MVAVVSLSISLFSLREASYAGLQQILTKIASAGLGSFLGVLKLFGPDNDNLLSFPMEGYTLAIDFKINRRLFPFLNELDRIVLEHGGRLYLAKDVRMSGAYLQGRLSPLGGFRRIARILCPNRKFISLQSQRLGI